MYKFVGNCANIINWYEFAETLKNIPDDLVKPVRNAEFTSDKTMFEESTDPKTMKIMQKWFDCNYNLDSVKWVNYQGIENYGNSITARFADWVGVQPLKSWVTRVDPGCTAPYHPDIEADLFEEQINGQIVRYTCHMCDDGIGAAFFLEDHFFYNQPNGNVYKWDNWLSWHGAVNAGTKPHWLFSFWGIIPKSRKN